MTPRLRSAIVDGVATGVLTLYPLGRAPKPVRIAWVAIPSAVAGALGAIGAREARMASIVTGAGVAAAVAGLQTVSLQVDRAIERRLRQWGVPKPRLAMGVAAGALAASIPLVSPPKPDGS